VRIGLPLQYAGDVRAAADQAATLEKAGLDIIWVAEVYGLDAVSLLGYLAATTETVGLGSGILNVYSRTPGLLAQVAAGLDTVSGRSLRARPRRVRSPGHRGVARDAVPGPAGPDP
jgi:alkanesulfonate monooxygenase SsuD/methylene tetrahydromethanopterin reductase-like flavin-dependent oxidoreductase (luciferase family)